MIKKAILGLAVAGMVGFGAAPVAAQVPVLTKDAEFPEGFGLLSTVRELADGRVMVADPLGQILGILDMASGSMEILGKEGPGPDEYRQPDAVFELPGDSTLLVDLGNSRLTVIDPEGTFARTMPLTRGSPGRRGLGGLQILIPRAVDERGRIYYQPPSFGAAGDSASVTRFDPVTDASDVLAKVKPAGIRRTGSGDNVQIRQEQMSPRDDWAVGSDGSIALVRSDGYYVQIVHTDGRVATGPKVEHRLLRPRDADKLAYLEATRAAGLSISAEVGPSGMQMNMSRGGSGRDPDINAVEWPDRMPAFQAGSAIIDPAGRVWVARTTRAGEDTLYDVFDGEGRKMGEVILAPNSNVTGFGSGTAYIVRTDEFGLQWLSRYKIA